MCPALLGSHARRSTEVPSSYLLLAIETAVVTANDTLPAHITTAGQAFTKSEVARGDVAWHDRRHLFGEGVLSGVFLGIPCQNSGSPMESHGHRKAPRAA